MRTVERAVHLGERHANVLEHRKVERAGGRHRGERLAVRDVEPVAADEFDLIVHHPVDVHDRLFADAADIDRFAAAAQRIDRVHQQRAGGAGAETIDHRIDAVPAGKGARPIGDRFAFVLRQNLDPLRRQRLDASKAFAVAGGAENAGDAAAERASELRRAQAFR